MTRTNEFGQPIGEALSDWAPCPFPDVTAMTGAWSRVEPLLLHHADELYGELCGPDNASLWTWLPVEMPEDELAFADLVETLALAIDQVSVVIRDGAGVARGMASFLAVDRGHGSVEIGWVALGPALQRTTASTEALYLMARHAFALGYRRLEWKCDSLNEPSRRAAERLGFTYEGRFRNARVVKGRNRDTDWFSITGDEWPGRAAVLQEWLSTANQPDGRQLRSVADIRAAR